MLENEEVELPLGTTASGTEGSQGHFNNVWIKSELTMLMNLPGCTLKPLALAVRRHPRALLCALAMGMSGAQAADAVDADTSGSAVSTSAAVVPATTQLQRVEVTGSAIRRVDAETAVPITILRADDLKKQGVTTTQEMVQRITGSQSINNSAGSVGAGTGGASFADMRGIGANKTLVLLNGRRLANNALSGVGTPNGSAIDLNMIPFAAIDRVEVLRDGASALYGTDAIGGVINFITKKSLTDGSLTLGGETPTASGGGATKDMSASWGFGDLEEDRFNVMGVFNYNKQQNLDANDRSFAKDYVPGRGLNQTSGTAYPGNYFQGDNSANPLGRNCGGPSLIASNGICRFSTREYIDLIPQTEKTSFFGRATGKLADDHNVSLEYFWARNNNHTDIGPAPLTGLSLDSSSPFYPGNGITPAPTDFTLDPTQPVSTAWRETAAGPRGSSDQNTSQRFLLNFDGLVGGWDYNVGASYNQNKVLSSLTDGYISDAAMLNGLANGTLNPFGPQTAAGQALIDANQYHGQYSSAVGRVAGLDARISREIGDWFGAGPAGIALGGEYRKEKMHQAYEAYVNDVSSLGADAAGSVEGDRSVKAEYAELNVPVLDSLELTAAVRHDKYSDFGSTTNPKYSFRYQPFKQLVVRGAYSEGFRAPSLYELYAPRSTTFTQGYYNDPVLCAGGVVQPGGNAGRDCQQQFLNNGGGNTELAPEKARNMTLGFVYQPVSNLSMGLDFWWIHISNQIQAFPESTVFDDPNTYADRYVRAADGSIANIVTGNANLGIVKTSGVDVTLDYRFPNTPYGQFGLGMTGTYVTRYDFQNIIDGPYTDKVGDFQGDGVISRWKHVLTGTWALGDTRASITNRFTSGYNDYDRTTNARVASYALWDMSVGHTFDKVLDIDAGVRNMFDRNPPFSNQAYNFQSGYDPRYADPLGRTLFARATYHF
ncbi:iron complex outermembrane recepter protein [Pseudomonas congelans]|uniref:Iron complex outermembrane recepter protein n=1 Tax=Pseudomonas congelans TaxID=200452 RepID=A0A1H0WC03_9PSED|nr:MULTISPECIES: TonB-dependent receptor [Pseudomonas]KFE46837.1 energy transducer TonB [Pseudomonas congelans]MBC8803145.1 TonB-dependent receptor [Pseudomonas congelans]SDP88232.1 iron complex outermembrane recepter protein [Pseudomonas congelans]